MKMNMATYLNTISNRIETAIAFIMRGITYWQKWQPSVENKHTETF